MPSVEEEVVEPTEELDLLPDEMPSEEAEVEETAEPNFDELLSNLKYQYDKEDYQPESLDEAKELIELGRWAKERGKPRLEEMKSDPLSNWAKSYMKESGFDDVNKFIEAVDKVAMENKIADKKNEYIEKGIGEEAAQLLAEKDIQLSQKEAKASELTAKDQKNQAYEGFLKWYDGMKEKGIFKGDLKADEIPQSVFDKADNGTPLEQAFLEWKVSDIKVATEQQTLKALKENKETSTGSVQEGSKTEPKTMTKSQVDALVTKMSSSEARKWVAENADNLEKWGYYD